jgi:hypothetical protein
MRDFPTAVRAQGRELLTEVLVMGRDSRVTDFFGFHFHEYIANSEIRSSGEPPKLRAGFNLRVPRAPVRRRARQADPQGDMETG